MTVTALVEWISAVRLRIWIFTSWMTPSFTQLNVPKILQRVGRVLFLCKWKSEEAVLAVCLPSCGHEGDPELQREVMLPFQTRRFRVFETFGDLLLIASFKALTPSVLSSLWSAPRL